MSEKFELCHWDIKRAGSAVQRGRETQRMTENGRDTRRIQRSTEY